MRRESLHLPYPVLIPEAQTERSSTRRAATYLLSPNSMKQHLYNHNKESHSDRSCMPTEALRAMRDEQQTSFVLSADSVPNKGKLTRVFSIPRLGLETVGNRSSYPVPVSQILSPGRPASPERSEVLDPSQVVLLQSAIRRWSIQRSIPLYGT